MTGSLPETADRLPYHPWRYWLPGLLLAGVGGLTLLLLVAFWGSWGYGAVLGIPFAIGCALGYGVRMRRIGLALIAFVIVVALIVGAVSAKISGLLCGTILGAILLAPVLVGALAGTILRMRLLRSRFGQRWYLPTLLLFALIGGAVALEHRLTTSSPVETVRTTRVLPVDASVAWASLVFYEEIRHAPPLLARIGLPHPLYTTGEIVGVGDLKTCVYDKGRLVKRITEFRPGDYLEFDVVEQQGIEDGSARLISGSFRFEPLGADRTRVTLTTVYEPLLPARLVWRPFEIRLARTLHEHVLKGIELESRQREQMLMARGGP